MRYLLYMHIHIFDITSMNIYDISRISSCSNQVFQETSIATGPVLCHPIDMLLVVEIP